MPPPGRVLLDTNIIIALFAGDSAVRHGAASLLSCDGATAVAYGELFISPWSPDSTSRVGKLARRQTCSVRNRNTLNGTPPVPTHPVHRQRPAPADPGH